MLKTTRKHLHDMELVSVPCPGRGARADLGRGPARDALGRGRGSGRAEAAQVEPMSSGLRKIGIAIREEEPRPALADVRRTDRAHERARDLMPSRPTDTLRGEAGDVTLDRVRGHARKDLDRVAPSGNATPGRTGRMRMRDRDPRGDRSCSIALAQDRGKGRQFSWHFVDIYQAIADGFDQRREGNALISGRRVLAGILLHVSGRVECIGSRSDPVQYGDNNEETMDAVIDAQAVPVRAWTWPVPDRGDYSARGRVFKIRRSTTDSVRGVG